MESRTALVVLVAFAISLVPSFARETAYGAPDIAGPDIAGPWRRPVDGALARAFVEPVARYGAGHRGVDFVAPSGTPVHAANAGTVVFAGAVAGSLHVVVLHAGGLRTSYSFLSRVDVRRGDTLTVGAVVGLAGGSGPEHEAGVLHFGLRISARYVDPMALFTPTDLSRIIRLTPIDEPAQVGIDPAAVEQRTIAESLHLPRGLARGLSVDGSTDHGSLGGGTAGDRGFDLLDAGASVLRRAGGVVGGVAERVVAGVGPPVRQAARWSFDRSPLAPAVHDTGEIVSRFGKWASSRRSCTADASTPPGGGGSGHHLLAVAGISSETDPATGATLDLDTAGLGYQPSEVRYFSYAARGSAYEPRATWGDLLGQAISLRRQLRAMQAADPGREVDLIGHSQGGVVIDAFLQLVYSPGDPTLPPIGTVVTIASPHQGAPVASLAQRLDSTAPGRAALAAIRAEAGDGIPPTGLPAVRELAEDSPLLRRLWTRRLPDQVDFTSISGADDVTVPANHTSVPGAEEVTVNPSGVVDHTGILRDPKATAAIRLALEGRPPPCVSWLDGLRGAVEPVVISRFENGVGALARDAARLVP